MRLQTAGSRADELKNPICAFLLLLLAGLLAPSAVAQTTATLSGTASDEAGAVLPGAVVTLKNVETGLTRTAKTNDQGLYTVSFLPVGTYSLTVEHQGFQGKTLSGIILQVDQKARVDITLSVAATAATVTVNAEAPLVNTASSDLGEVIENKRIVDLPLNGRQFSQLILLTAGATSGSIQGGVASGFQVGGAMVSVNGARANQNEFTLDGVSITDDLFNTLNMSPSVDAIEEFKVQSGLYSAETGQEGGAHVNIVLKSGTDKFHGSLFEFLRNDKLDAKNFFDRPDRPIPAFRQNQFGFTFGGPIRKDKSFFFGNYEGLRIRQAITAVTSVPPASLRLGDFSGLAPIKDPLTGQPFTGNVIPPNRIDPVAKAILAFVPLPSLPGLASNLVSAPILSNDQDQFNVRVDHRFSGKDSFSARFSFSNATLFDPFVRSQTVPTLFGAPGFGQGTSVNARNLMLSHTHIFSSALVNEFRFGYNRTVGSQQGEHTGLAFAAQNGIQGVSTNPNDFGLPLFNTGVFGSFGDPSFFIGLADNHFQYIDNLSYTRGAHALKMGGEIRRIQDKGTIPLFVRGVFGFTSRYTGNGFADFLLGFPTQLQTSQGPALSYARAWGYHGYFQDDWKVSRKLTLNLGLRYEYNTRAVDKFNNAVNFDFTTGKLVIVSNGGKVAPGPFSSFVANNPSLFETSEQAGWPRSLINPERNDLAPRIGFAYAPLGSQRVAIRGGYGVFYDQFNALVGPFVLTRNPPFTSVTSTNNTLPLPTLTTSTGLASASLALSPQVVDRNFKRGRIQQWGLNIQTQLTGSMLLELGYVGSHGQNLDRVATGNQAVPGPGSLASRRQFPAFGDLNLQTSKGYSNYNGMNLRLERRFSRGLGFNVAYTFSKSLDTGSINSTNPNETERSQDSNAPVSAEYGLSAFNSRHRFVASVVYQLPFGSDQRFLKQSTGTLGKFVNGWLVTGIITHESGKPFTINSNADTAGVGNTFQRPNMIRDPNLPSSQRSPAKWFDTGAFVAPPAGQFGNAGRSVVLGPAFDNVDFSVVKQTAITERQRLEFRAEIFNLLNHPNLGLPVRILGSPSFGQIVTANFSRQIQFGLKYVF
jgi:Carboxypeptidase regulatory-like domain